MSITVPEHSAAAMRIRPGDKRGVTELGWLHSRHSFAFGRYRDPADPHNAGFRSLRVINDDIVEPGQGFGEHGHDNMEILTWVLAGGLKHGDSLGNMKTLGPGELQAMSAGTGIRHSEFNASDAEPVHFLQVWIEPEHRDATPRYDQRTFDAAGRRNRWQIIAAGGQHAADNRSDTATAPMPVDRDAALRVADLDPSASLDLAIEPDRHGYVHVAHGRVRINGRDLVAGDACIFEQPGSWSIRAVETAQLLWFDLS